MPASVWDLTVICVFGISTPDLFPVEFSEAELFCVHLGGADPTSQIGKSDVLAVHVNRVAVLVRDAVSEDGAGAWS